MAGESELGLPSPGPSHSTSVSQKVQVYKKQAYIFKQRIDFSACPWYILPKHHKQWTIDNKSPINFQLSFTCDATTNLIPKRYKQVVHRQTKSNTSIMYELQLSFTNTASKCTLTSMLFLRITIIQ